MIIASILEVSQWTDGSPSAQLMGGQSVIFYTQDDAVAWASAMSEDIVYGTGAEDAACLTVVYNTETTQKRWWFRGVEYTG